ncbi:pV [Bat mastadenovirus]|uniref:PV n=1 Tax=Bat mastadenovirus TaxID=740971 RepID=A0A3G9ETA3_9ADEN|nr:pV [Bat mastadenovirus]BBE29310.1 pV [Bat mastadenovirus]
MAAISRAVKQELLDDLYPEIYVPKSRRRTKVKTEEKVDVKTLVKAKSKKRRAAKRDAAEEEVEFVRNFAPRRPYQWKGRKVRAMVRPGVPVVFTPGQRSGKASKRVFDEVYADEDILDQAGAYINEFAYGKRAKLLTNFNPTPSQVPLTPQEPVVRPGEAKLLPTVQVLAPKDIKNEPILPVSKSEAGDVKIENKGLEHVAPGLAVQTVDIKVPIKRKRGADGETAGKKIREELEPMDTTLKLEYSEEPEMETFDNGVEPRTFFEARPIAVSRRRRPPVERMEVQQSAPTAVATTVLKKPPKARPGIWGPANSILPNYRYHPSINAARIVGETPRGRISRWGPANSIIPEVRLHPSMLTAITSKRPSRRRRRTRKTRRAPAFVVPATTKTGVLLPQTVRYHPTIVTRRA